ncbi:MAG: hypothetical protein IJT27_01335, partial [Clostridia bacterium]|nr:hypothetical protein [Clostridia bacterium]
AVKENEVPASVTAGGSYDLVIYCADCGNEVSRTTVYTDPISTEGHVPGEAVRENEVPATCSAGGSYDLVYYCTDCGIEITRTTVYTEPTQHEYGEQVIDREPTATEPGLAHRACIHCGDVIEFEIPAGTTGGGTDVVESGKIVSSGSFIERILAFFRKIIEFFANLSI